MPGVGGPSPIGTGMTGNGLLDEEAYNRARQAQAMQGLWAGLLSASGPSLSPRGMGSSFGAGLLGQMQAGNQFDENQLNQAKVALARAGIPKTEAEIRKLDREGKLDELIGDMMQRIVAGGGIGGAPSYSPMGGGALPGASSGGSGNVSDPRGLVPYIRETAAKYGIDPDTAVRVAQSEGLGQFYGDGGKSGGAFQLYTGGGEGNNFQRDTGLDPLDPKNERATIDYALRVASQKGWGPWNGAKKIGITGFTGIGGARSPEQMASTAIPEFAGGRAAQLGGGILPPQQVAAAPTQQGISEEEYRRRFPGGSAGPPGGFSPPMGGSGGGLLQMDAEGAGGDPGGGGLIAQMPRSAQPAPVVPPIAQPPQQMTAPPVAPSIAMPASMPQGAAPQPVAPPPMQAPGPQGYGNINPSQSALAQALALGMAQRGRTVPGFINQTAELPLAGARAAAEAAAKQPYLMQMEAYKQMGELQKTQYAHQLGLDKSRLDSELQLYNQGFMPDGAGGVVPVPGRAEGDAAAAGQKAAAEDAARRTTDQKEYDSYVRQELAAGRQPMSQIDYIKAVKQAGATNVSQKIEGQGQAKMIEFGIKQMDGAFQAESAAQKRTQVYGQMAEAMKGFTPGATADLQRRAGAILKEFGIEFRPGGVASAETFQQAAQKLQLAAAPQGQGAVSNYERELYAKASPQLINTPEALSSMIQIGQRLDDYDRQVAQIHRDVARESGGLPNPLEAQQRIAALGPPLSPGEMQALQGLQKPPETNAPASGGRSGTTSGGIPWSVR